jgi:hypothetical protein
LIFFYTFSTTCHEHENYKDEWEKDKSKFKSKNNQNKNTSAKIKNMKCARSRYKQIFIMIKQENVNTKIT